MGLMPPHSPTFVGFSHFKKKKQPKAIKEPLTLSEPFLLLVDRQIKKDITPFKPFRESNGE